MAIVPVLPDALPGNFVIKNINKTYLVVIECYESYKNIKYNANVMKFKSGTRVHEFDYVYELTENENTRYFKKIIKKIILNLYMDKDICYSSHMISFCKYLDKKYLFVKRIN